VSERAITDASPPITCRGLTRTFGRTVALAPLDLDVSPGQVTGLLGPNGSGKSTLLRCLVGLVRPDSGTARVAGVQVVGDGTAVRRRVTYAPGELHLYGEMRGGEQIDWLLRGRGARARRRGRSVAAELGLPLSDKVRGYSHGMKRQLCFAAAMAPDVAVRILDEPSEGLDPTKRSELLSYLAEDAAGDRTILLSSHHLGEVALACQRLVFLNEGRVIADETPASVQERAARLLHLASAGKPPGGLAAALAGPHAESVTIEGSRVTVLLAQRDPRPFLAALARQSDLPAPAEIEIGRLSLQGLYRDLYGVAGV